MKSIKKRIYQKIAECFLGHAVTFPVVSISTQQFNLWSPFL